MRQLLCLCLILLAQGMVAQKMEQPAATTAKDRIESYAQHQALGESSLVRNIPFTSIGPTVFSGRIVDLDVWEKDPSHFYAAYASGGLWKTTNNGISFEPLFDDQMVMTLGDIAVDWDNNIIYAGTGENNSSRSSYAGVGMYKSMDGGASWRHIGLEESHHISRIIIHPDDPNTVWVAVLGHLYSPNAERGLYKTTDGGQSWQQTLYVNDNAGAVDLIIDPENPDVLYCATWERTRRAWNFVESGEGSGIYKSTDGGDTWVSLTPKDGVFPADEGAGRIGLALHKENGKSVLYASIDNYNRRPAEDNNEDESLTKDDLRNMSSEDFLKLEKSKITAYLREYRFPRKYNTDAIMNMVKSGKIKPIALVEYVEDANSLLFDTPVIGLEIYRSEDEGKSWTRAHDGYIDGVYSSYGYYFGQIRVSPHDADKIYVLGVPVIKSEDGGKSWKSINGDNVHSDHHALWLNPNRADHLILGNDGGVNISYDDGEKYAKCNTPSVGQFYYVAADMAEPYNVYGGLQDNGVWMGPSTYQSNTSWHGSGQYPYRRIYGGDGMQVMIDSRDNETVYTGLQFGNYARLNTRTGERQSITPRHELGDRPLRWNWQTPIHLSVHNQDILYMGSNKLHRSMDQGDHFSAISGDLTQGGIKGDVPFGTLTTIHESPLQFGLLYVGSDDGLVHVTKDGGATWTDISQGLPDNMWVARVQASSFVEGRVYAVLNGYRWDDFKPYAYVSDDYGQSWQAIGKDLPLEPLNVIKEDPANENIIYVGSDHGLYVSLNRGSSFMLMDNGLPAVPVHDVVIHPRDKDIIVGTHGRSIYKGPANELQQLNDELLAQTIHVFDIQDQRSSPRWGSSWTSWTDAFEPKTTIPIFTNKPGKLTIRIKHDNLVLQKMEVEVHAGLHYLDYDYSIMNKQTDAYAEALNASQKKNQAPIEVKAADNKKTYLKAGTYTLECEMNGDKSSTTLTLK
ncbi:MAG: glycosyl hydrolase [Saprospiraceae bacterium]|nr:glycosyl hydrolase [Saprospiraceae bacterium]